MYLSPAAVMRRIRLNFPLEVFDFLLSVASGDVTSGTSSSSSYTVRLLRGMVPLCLWLCPMRWCKACGTGGGEGRGEGDWWGEGVE